MDAKQENKELKAIFREVLIDYETLVEKCCVHDLERRHKLIEQAKYLVDTSPLCICGHGTARHFGKGHCQEDDCKCNEFVTIDHPMAKVLQEVRAVAEDLNAGRIV